MSENAIFYIAFVADLWHNVYNICIMRGSFMPVRQLVLHIFLWALIAAAALFVIYLAVLAIAPLFVDTKKEYDKDSRFFRFLLYSSTAIGMRIMRLHFHVSGIEKLPKDSRFLLVGNHLSNFDPIIEWHILRKFGLAFISKEGNFKIPIWGRIIRKCCFLSIDRENARNAMRTINKAAELIRADEVSVAVYPEGTRSKSGELLPFHNGVFKIAKKAGVPIVVAVIKNTNRIAKNYPWHKTDVYLDFVTVIGRDEVKANTSGEIGDKVHEIMKNYIENKGD